MNNLDEFKGISIGSRVAEEEFEGLKNYFIKTYLWEQILSQDIDIIFGCKGSGKSALYGSLSNYEYEIMGENVLLLLAENPRGAVAFKDLSTSPPKNEFEFKSIWKLYFILLIYQKLFDNSSKDIHFKEVTEKLQESDLIPRGVTYSSMIKQVRSYIRRINPTLEPNVTLNENTGGIERIGFKISLSEPDTKQTDKGIVSVDSLFSLINQSLIASNMKIWVAIDRLDAVFQEDFELEAKALRTLFQFYIELQAYTNIRLIIFLRDDIWNRIIEKGFRETSHITKKETITWDKNTLFTLIMIRFEQNQKFMKYLEPV